MKTNSFFKLKNTKIIFMMLCLISASIFFACEDNSDEGSATASFMIEGNPTGLAVTKAAKTQSFTVRSNRPWKIVAQTTDTWARAFPAEGDDDGIFSMIVTENATFVPRTMNFAIVVDGEEQPVLFAVTQEANVPYITINEATGVTIPAAGGNAVLNIKSNVTWKYTLSDASWLTEAAVSTTQLTLKAGNNDGALRSTIATLTAVDYPNIKATVTINQAPGSVIIQEDFNWLTYGNAVFYTTTGETRYESWTDAEKNKGWTTTVNPAYKNYALYARPGFVKIGLTSYGGDLISPKFVGIVGTKNVQVKFKAVPYMTATGTKDDNILVVSVIGPGTVSTSQFTIDNWPNYTTDPNCTEIWKNSATERTFLITGATAETQVKFLGRDYALTGVGVGKNRIFLDDIKVEIVK